GADLLEHYLTLAGLLADLLDFLGTPAPEEPFLLPPAIVAALDHARVSSAVQKARASHVLKALREEAAALAMTGVAFGSDFTNGGALVEGFRRADGVDSVQDALGWQ